MDKGAWRLVDRLLKATLGGVALAAIFPRIGENTIDMDRVRELAGPKIHPMGSWMNMVKDAHGLRHDWKLAFSLSDRDDYPPEGRIRKWRCGQNMLPHALAQAMMANAPGEPVLRQALVVARTFSLAIDLVQSASADGKQCNRRSAQLLIAQRLGQLEKHLLAATVQSLRSPAAS